MMSDADTVSIHGLKISAVVGVYAWERELRQPLVIDVDMQCDTRAAATSDALEDALNYAAVAQRIEAYVQDANACLIERLAGGIADLVLTEFSATVVRVSVRKPGAVRNADAVGVTISRQQPAK